MDFLDQKLHILVQILLSLLKFVPKGTIDSSVILVQVTGNWLLNKLQAMTWANDDLNWHVCITGAQRVNNRVVFM